MTNGSKVLSQAVCDALEQIVGKARLLRDSESLLTYGKDWTTAYEPAPGAVVLPNSIEEVQAIVRLANRERFAIVPSGGRTGLSGGAVAMNGELLLALVKMNRISDFNSVDGTVVCEAGVITQQLQEFAETRGLYYPVDFASSGSSQIGGNIATNAGGIRVIRYGMTRQWVAGLKVVTGKGDLLDLNRGLVKNNAGYDLRQLFIGSEGTLGIIVEATMKLIRPPKDRHVMVLGVPQMIHIPSILERFQKQIDLSAFEFFSEKALVKVIENGQLMRPFETQTEYYALIEFEVLSDETIDQSLSLFEECVDQGWVIDGVVSQSQTQAKSLWRLREDISETIAKWSPYKNDISTTTAKIPDFLREVEAVVNREYPEFEIIWFGHIGDGNIHLNILKPEDLEQREFHQCCSQVSRLVFEVVERYGGSISAEHGVGLLKRNYLPYCRTKEEISYMREIKDMFDPNGVMNPGKLL